MTSSTSSGFLRARTTSEEGGLDNKNSDEDGGLDDSGVKDTITEMFIDTISARRSSSSFFHNDSGQVEGIQERSRG